MATRSPIWHPFTQHAVMPEMTKIAESSGAYLTKPDGEKLLDAIASWWVVTHGHCHPHVIGAIKDQADKLDQVIFAGHTHEPAERLAQQLLKCTPDGWTTCSFQIAAPPVWRWRSKWRSVTGIICKMTGSASW